MNKLQEHSAPECALCHNYISVPGFRNSEIQLVNCINIIIKKYLFQIRSPYTT